MQNVASLIALIVDVGAGTTGIRQMNQRPTQVLGAARPTMSAATVARFQREQGPEVPPPPNASRPAGRYT